MINSYYNPVKTMESAGVFLQLPEVIKSMGSEKTRVLVIAWCEDVFAHEVFQKMGDYSVKKLVFTESNPTVEQLFQVYLETKEFSPEVVVAVGGGSIIDVAKSLCCMYEKEIADEDELRILIQEKKFGPPAVRWIGVPTTAGTGSEVTCWATIWDPKKDAKRSLENHDNYAYAALVDSDLTKNIPLKLAVSSALDAVAHAVESYWAKGTNLVSRAMALQAVSTIMENMGELLSGKAEAHEAMAQGSMLAGMAFSNTKTTACHSISYPLTMHYGIPHGVAVSMLLAPVLKMNAPVVDGMEELFHALHIKDAETLRKYIGYCLKQSGHPNSLKEWGVKREELSHLAELGMTKGRADNNPVELTQEKVLGILESIYEEANEAYRSAI